MSFVIDSILTVQCSSVAVWFATFCLSIKDYEIGDLVVVVDSMAKEMTENLTGKPYETGDLSKELDKRVKSAVADFCGNDDYEFGDLTREIDRRVKDRVAEYIGKERYEFGDISKEIEKRRREWVKDYLGEDASKEYQVSDSYCCFMLCIGDISTFYASIQ